MVGKTKFGFKVDPTGTFKKALQLARKHSDDLRRPFKLITDSFYKTNKALFPEEGTMGPDVFEDLDEDYKIQKDKKS